MSDFADEVDSSPQYDMNLAPKRKIGKAADSPWLERVNVKLQYMTRLSSSTSIV